MATKPTTADPIVTEGNDDYPEEVQDPEPELRQVELSTDIAFLAADYLNTIFSFDPTPDVTNWDRNLGNRPTEDYSYHNNAYRQLIAEGRGSGGQTTLRLSWIQTMDIVFALQNALNPNDADFPPRYSESAPLGHLDRERVENAVEALNAFKDNFERQ